jgi:hypothetical protein
MTGLINSRGEREARKYLGCIRSCITIPTGWHSKYANKDFDHEQLLFSIGAKTGDRIAKITKKEWEVVCRSRGKKGRQANKIMLNLMFNINTYELLQHICDNWVPASDPDQLVSVPSFLLCWLKEILYCHTKTEYFNKFVHSSPTKKLHDREKIAKVHLYREIRKTLNTDSALTQEEIDTFNNTFLWQNTYPVPRSVTLAQLEELQRYFMALMGEVYSNLPTDV